MKSSYGRDLPTNTFADLHLNQKVQKSGLDASTWRVLTATANIAYKAKYFGASTDMKLWHPEISSLDIVRGRAR